ncbi:hypothetical protein Tco_0319312 [Tanacetum coccineum]
MRTRRSNFPSNSNITIPRRRRRQASNIVEPEIRTIVEMADNRTMAHNAPSSHRGIRMIAIVWISQISQEISQKRTRERMSDQEAKEIKAKARENQASAFYSQPQLNHSQLSKPAPLFVNSRATFAISES